MVAPSRPLWQPWLVVTIGAALGAVAEGLEARQTVSVDSIPGTLVTFELVRVPGGKMARLESSESDSVELAPFWIGRTEVTWDAYDVFAFRLDREASEDMEADAFARPSRPYGAPDWGYGHRGYPVISVTRKAAEAFCLWLSAKTGNRYRLPTEAEWEWVGMLAFPDTTADPATYVRRRAWFGEHAGGTTHEVGTRDPDALGLYDLLGNAAEWVTTRDGGRVVRGGSFQDTLVEVSSRGTQTTRWNETDPQIPKSQWWLSDGPFVGFRLVREPNR